MNLIQRAHGKDCLCWTAGVRGFHAFVVADPVPGRATYMGIWGDGDYPVHVWDLDWTPWRPTVRDDGERTIVAREPVTDEQVQAIREAIQIVAAGPMPMSAYRRDPAPERAPFPEPLVSSRDGWRADVMPGPVHDLVALAESRGWITSEPQYAEGFTPHASHGTPSAKPKTSWAVRMRRGEMRAIAVRMDGSWTSLWVLGPDGMERHTTLGAFQEAIS